MELIKTIISNTTVQITGDISSGKFRIYVTPKYRLTVFKSIHNLRHGGYKWSIELIKNNMYGHK